MKTIRQARPVLALLLVTICFRESIAQESPRPADAPGPGDHTRRLTVGELARGYQFHIPVNYNPESPTPVVLALHGAMMNGPMMVPFSGLNAKSDAAGFVVAYPDGTGAGPFLTWNAGGFMRGKWTEGRPDDVAFIGKLLDDLATVVNVDGKRVYACGMSNGGMMCYRLAAELSDRIAAIAPVAGTMALEESKPARPVPVIHFHGTNDTLVPFESSQRERPRFIRLRDVAATVRAWVELNGCDETPATETLTEEGDELTVTRATYAGGDEGAEVVLVVVEGGGHTWPGQKPPLNLLGKSTLAVSANDLMWDFFQKHPMK